ncbi:GAF domain-containing protein [Actinomadura sp. WMMB 499]|uniref:helix-turn-helix domain-containing protein n=1 Tax=Actinomadura sp. WMMB 499 TaxID=1219491 RepID=UPI001247B8DC|nr:GAF domain-containing protein [Actinomadura sp. WMMB 499]QFG21408.1 GAF domain-containing protein [Actinomadura sp. WMMB 499]
MNTRELQALYDLALRLSGVHDLDALLQDVVAQARRMLDVDIAYLALVEDDGGLTIEVTDGSLGPRLRGVRLAPHVGVAGRVADRGEPVRSSDYLADRDLTHSDAVDRVAREEGLRTIVGVPLRLRGRVIGVLMVAQRRVREFTGRDMSFLTSLGSFAAVAIDNARLITEHRRAAAELTAANAELRRHVGGAERAARMHGRMLAIALRGDGAEEVVLAVSAEFSGTVLLLDERDRPRVAASGGRVRPAPRFAGERPSAAFAAERRTRRDGDTVTVPVASARAYFGALRVTPGAPLQDQDVRVLERAAMTLALVLVVERAVGDAERRTATDLVEQLVGGRIGDEAAFARRARSVGLDLRAAHRVLVAEAADDAGALERLGELVRERGGLAARLRGRLVALVRADGPDGPDGADGADGADEAALRAFAATVGGTCGLGGPATGAADLAAAHADASACVTVLKSLAREGTCAAPSDLGPYRYLLSASGRADADRFVRATVGPLLDHDARRGGDLVRTADAFLTGGRHHTGTAAALHVHANTLYQRLDRITALLGDGWRDGDRALDVQLALRLHRLANDLCGDPPPNP